MPVPIDPSMALGGPEWQIAPVEGAGPATAPSEGAAGSGFGGMLGDALGSLVKAQTEAAAGAQ